jgi:hypothetical protein
MDQGRGTRFARAWSTQRSTQHSVPKRGVTLYTASSAKAAEIRVTKPLRDAPRRPVMRSGRPYKHGVGGSSPSPPISTYGAVGEPAWFGGRVRQGGHRRALRAAECPKPPSLPQRRGSSRLTGSRGSMTLGAGRHGEGQRAVRCLRPEGMVRIGRRAHRDSTDEAPCARRACRVLFASAAGGHANECATPY